MPSPAAVRIRILNPVGELAPRSDHLDARRDLARTLRGAVIGVLTNNFRGYDVPGAVAQQIAQRSDGEVAWYSKPNLSHPAAQETVQALAKRVDAAIIGLAG